MAQPNEAELYLALETAANPNISAQDVALFWGDTLLEAQRAGIPFPIAHGVVEVDGQEVVIEIPDSVCVNGRAIIPLEEVDARR